MSSDVKEQTAAAAAKGESGIAAMPLIVVTQFGYFEDLGKELLPENQPVAVKTKLVSIIAKKKITKTG